MIMYLRRTMKKQEKNVMVRILNTTKGWCYQSNTEVAYYKTLHEVMAVAYAKEFKSPGNSRPIC